MIGDMISMIRNEKGLTKSELARRAGVDIGHLTHIEKGERNPSRKLLKRICNALSIPYQQLMYTYDKYTNENPLAYSLIEYISYDKVLAVDKLDNFIPCPASIGSASLAVKMPDNSMEPTYKKKEYLFIEFNSLLNNNDIGLFKIDDKFYIRRFFNQKEKIILKADNSSFPDISIENTSFYIIGKVLN